MTPNSLTLNHLRQLGFTATVCESWIPKVEKRRDLFGIADVIAVHPRDGIVLLVQATSLGHVGDRLARVKRRPALLAWLKAGGEFWVMGWRGPEVKIVAVRSEDLAGVTIAAPRSRRARKFERQGELFVLA